MISLARCFSISNYSTTLYSFPVTLAASIHYKINIVSDLIFLVAMDMKSYRQKAYSGLFIVTLPWAEVVVQLV